MQAWQQVKVTNKESAFFGVAGCVVRVERTEKKGRAIEVVFVRLDGDDEPVEQFDPTELEILG